MTGVRVALIAAVAENGVIGAANAMPWRLSTDVARFKRLTLGKPVVMGRKTFLSIGRPLAGRLNIVVTRDANYRREDVTVVHGVDEALRAAAHAPEVMVIGGADLFRLFLPRAARIHLTRVHAEVDGNVLWPELDDTWAVVSREPHAADERHAYPMTFEVWERR